MADEFTYSRYKKVLAPLTLIRYNEGIGKEREYVGAYKCMRDGKVWLDLSDIKVPSWKIREVQKASHKKLRDLRKTDPFAKVGGCRRKYDTPEALRKACDEYFKDQECYIYDKNGYPLRDPETDEYVKSTRPLTVSGLARYIGFTQSRALKRYTRRAEGGKLHPDYLDVLYDALQRIEEYSERRGYDKDGAGGSKFVLKSAFGWTEPMEEAQIRKLRLESEVKKAKLEMEQELHRLKVQLLKLGMDAETVDNEIRVTIRRAGLDSDD